MFDYVNVEMPCPNCGTHLRGFQSKDGACNMDTIEPEDVSRFYCYCQDCGHWIEFARAVPEPTELRASPQTRSQVEAMGFSLLTDGA